MMIKTVLLIDYRKRYTVIRRGKKMVYTAPYYPPMNYGPQTVYVDIFKDMHFGSLYEEFEAAVQSYEAIFNDN